MSNQLLATFPAETSARMADDLQQVSLVQGEVLYKPGAQIDEIYFPETGLISLLVESKEGGLIETAIIGCEGALGLHSALGRRVSFIRAIVQIGGIFSIIRAEALASIVKQNATVRDLIARYTELLWLEAQQLTACNAVHAATGRFCRWLLQCADRINSDQLPLKQESVAQMLGVRRTTITLLAQKLQRRGLIKYARGRIMIVDRRALEDCSCECYAVLQEQKVPGEQRRLPDQDDPRPSSGADI